MNWKTQPRDNKGRFIKAVNPPKVSRRRNKVVNKQFCCFLLDDTSSIQYNRLVQTLESGINEALIAVKQASKENKVETYYGFSLFGHPSNRHYLFSKVKPEIRNYNPNQGWTALYDAIGYGIETTEKYIQEYNIPSKNVQFTIFTDGDENASKVYNATSIKKLIEQKISEGWSINFMGGGDADSVMKAAESMGIYAANTVSFNTDVVETTRAIKKYAKSTQSYTAGVSKGENSNIGFFAD
jgi:hypothetical protein